MDSPGPGGRWCPYERILVSATEERPCLWLTGVSGEPRTNTIQLVSLCVHYVDRCLVLLHDLSQIHSSRLCLKLATSTVYCCLPLFGFLLIPLVSFCYLWLPFHSLIYFSLPFFAFVAGRTNVLTNLLTLRLIGVLSHTIVLFCGERQISFLHVQTCSNSHAFHGSEETFQLH